jgi:hypothetical protein
MAKLIATDTQRFSNLVKHEYEPSTGYCREVVTYNGAAKSFAVGDLVTATGTVPADDTEIFGIVLEDVDAAASTATKVLVLAGGPAIVSKFGVKLGLLVAADVWAALDAKGIKASDAV